ncbi:MAG TPA: hypothetical protein VJU87_07975 [Gemmatimonadaceae bacterium]|nr:hypothetical protein [Gemmatimonadaceae bacterium]
MPPAYTTYGVAPSRSQTLVIRTGVRDPYALVAAVRAALREIDPHLALYDGRRWTRSGRNRRQCIR